MSSTSTCSGTVALRVRSPFRVVADHLAEVPVHRAIIRSMECVRFLRLEMAHPLLDLGCGDGHFAAMLFAEPVLAGVDVDRDRVREARARGVYRIAMAASATALPFPGGSFRTVVSNCVVEHIPDLRAVLREVARVLEPEGTFAFSVPSERFADYLLGSTMARRLGLNGLARWYGSWFNRVSRHYHCYSTDAWRGLLEAAGLRAEHVEPYMSPTAHRLFDLSHYYGAPTLLTRKVLGRWVLLRDKWRYWPPEMVLARVIARLVEEAPAEGAYLFIVARKVGS